MSNEAKILAGIGAVTLVLVIGASLLFGGKSSPNKEEAPLSAEIQKTLVREDSPKKGSEKGKVTIVEFSDFQCPACGAAYPIVKQLTAEYKDKVTFVYRHFPLSIHKNAEAAALAAEVAGKQGKFFEMHDLIFDKQKEWSESNKAKDLFVSYAEELKLDVEKFKADMDDKKLKEKVQRDVNDGLGASVNSTPTFFINGVRQAGGLPYDDFKAKIDEALKSAK